MKRIFQISLAKKLTFSTILLLASCIVAISSLAYLTILDFGNEFLESELEQKSEFIKKAFSEPIWTYDQHQIGEIGDSLVGNYKYTYISAIRVESPEHEVLFEKGHGESPTFLTAERLPYTKTRVIDIYKDQKKIGMVSVAMTNLGYVNAFRSQFIFLILSGFALMIILSQLVNYYIAKTLTKPMSKILNQVKQIESGNYGQLNYENLPHELKTISRALNEASCTIEKRNDDIKYYTEDLEKLVQERTFELKEQLTKNLNTARLAAVGELAADVAHEINNPLTVIDLHATRLKKFEKEFNLNPSMISSIDKIQFMIKRIGKIIKGLKSLSRDGNSDPMIPFQASNILEDVKALVEMKLRANEIHFEVVAPEPSPLIIGREVQIAQVLVNLIGNAVDAISHLDLKWVKLEVKAEGDFISFSVTDCGLGIPDEIIQKIMNPFFTTKDVNKGTGLGLSISKNIIEEHGGVLEYNSNHPHTQFVFTLKRADVSQMSA